MLPAVSAPFLDYAQQQALLGSQRPLPSVGASILESTRFKYSVADVPYRDLVAKFQRIAPGGVGGHLKKKGAAKDTSNETVAEEEGDADYT